MLTHCDACPDESVIKSFVIDKLPMKYSRDSTIKFSQWNNTDHSQLEENECEFVKKLTNMFYELTEHHYIAKSQSKYFKHRKASLTSDECVIVLDFAENYSLMSRMLLSHFIGTILKQQFIPCHMYYKDKDTGSIHHNTYACI